MRKCLEDTIENLVLSEAFWLSDGRPEVPNCAVSARTCARVGETGPSITAGIKLADPDSLCTERCGGQMCVGFCGFLLESLVTSVCAGTSYFVNPAYLPHQHPYRYCCKRCLSSPLSAKTSKLIPVNRLRGVSILQTDLENGVRSAKTSEPCRGRVPLWRSSPRSAAPSLVHRL
jgi:hypothetical protein